MDGQAADLGASRLQWSRDGSGFRPVAIEGERSQRCGGQVDGIPLQYERGLRGVAETQDRRGGCLHPIRVEDAFL